MPERPADKMKLYSALRGLPGKVIILDEADALIDKVADDLTARILQRYQLADQFHLALSGGTTPRELFRRLIIDPGYRIIPWVKGHIWQVDERCVEADSEQRNYRMLRDLLVDHVPTPADQVHPMPVEEPGGDAIYHDAITHQVPRERDLPRLDYVLLGMGGDGHTASLFPQSPALGERRRWAVFNDGDQVAPPRPRMTLTYPVLNAARTIAILVTGESKHATLQRVSLSRDERDRLPITGIEPAFDDAELIWYLDRPAAAGPEQ